jgi:hypothetical protein
MHPSPIAFLSVLNGVGLCLFPPPEAGFLAEIRCHNDRYQINRNLAARTKPRSRHRLFHQRILFPHAILGLFEPQPTDPVYIEVRLSTDEAVPQPWPQSRWNRPASPTQASVMVHAFLIEKNGKWVGDLNSVLESRWGWRRWSTHGNAIRLQSKGFWAGPCIW